jgi:hypothetical protein
MGDLCAGVAAVSKLPPWFAGLQRPTLILSLCDFSGVWSQPYVDDAYEVVRVDLKRGQDVRLLELPDRPVHGILAAPPCTVFANSGARWERTDDAMREGLSIVDACCRLILATRPDWWVLENPAGKLSRYLGQPQMTFQPNDYGDPYTKLTCLWGEFNTPIRSPVEASLGSKMHRVAPGHDRAAIRSETPAGFARAFFEANP